MGNYEETVSKMPVNPDVTTTANYRNHKWGWVVNASQELSKNLGSFLRISWNDGKNETWAYTEIDRSINAGIVLNKDHSDNNNTLGFGVVLNGLSKPHRDYISSGGYGFIIGDGRLNYAPEFITELFYRINFFNSHLQVSPDLQLAVDPAYNKDRGPVPIFGLRTHIVL